MTAGRLPVWLDLPGGRRMLLRRVEPADLDAVRRLYERLSPEGVYRRFFTSVLPQPSFFERLVRVEERGGFGIVALVEEDDDGTAGRRLVGEIDVEPLVDGNGELAIVVDAAWRGWLGPYLVELASREAAARDMPNLEAEVLTCNRPMRAVTRARGEAFLPTSDWQEVRVVFSTSGSAPGWSPGQQPRVLVEQRGVAFDAVAGLRAAGLDVIACAGRTAGRPACPLLEGGRCPLAEGADAIVVAMAPGTARDRLVAAHRASGAPVVVVEPNPRRPIDAEALIGAARSVLERPRSDLDVGADLEHLLGREPEEP